MLTFPLPRRMPLSASPGLAFGLVVGTVLPLVAALLYRSYGYDLQPEWLNTTRQLGLVWVTAELGFVMWRRHHGYDPVALIRALPRGPRAALLLFLATFWISSLTTRVPSFSLGLAVGDAVHLLFAGALYQALRDRPAPAPAALGAGIALGLALLVPVVAGHLLVPGSVIENYSGAIPGFISHRLFGAWAAAAAALLLGIAWTHRAGTEPIPAWLFPALTLALGLVAWTGTRAALVGLAAAVAAGCFLAARPRAGLWPRLLLCVLVAGVVGTALAPPDPAFSFLRPEAALTANGITSSRAGYWHDALVVAARQPWLGNGMGASLWLVPNGAIYHVQPHNVLVQFLLFWGLVPTLPALWLLGLATWRAHRRARRIAALVPLVMMLDCLLAMSLLDGMLHFERFVMLVLALLAFCLAARDPAPR